MGEIVQDDVSTFVVHKAVAICHKERDRSLHNGVTLTSTTKWNMCGEFRPNDTKTTANFNQQKNKNELTRWSVLGLISQKLFSDVYCVSG